MAIGVRVEHKYVHQLDQLARNMDKNRSAYVREVIAQYVQHFSIVAEVLAQSGLIAAADCAPDWSEQLID